MTQQRGLIVWQLNHNADHSKQDVVCRLETPSHLLFSDIQPFDFKQATSHIYCMFLENNFIYIPNMGYLTLIPQRALLSIGRKFSQNKQINIKYCFIHLGGSLTHTPSVSSRQCLPQIKNRNMRSQPNTRVQCSAHQH